MSRNLSSNADLAGKYAIGEIIDMVGVPDYYDAGTSKWMKSNTWVPAASLSSATKSDLKANYTRVALATNAAVAAYGSGYAFLNTMTPAATTASATVFPCNTDNTVAKCLVVNASGVSAVSIGQTTGYNMSNYGGGHIITSDGTNLFSWAGASSGTAFKLHKSTDNGATWASTTITSQPTFSNTTSHPLGPAGTQTYRSGLGEVWKSQTSYFQFAAYCGARHLLLGLNGSNQYIAATSSDGGANFSDVSAALMGSATLGASIYGWFYRNGNTCFLSAGGASRKSTDGGATWAAATNAIAATTTTQYRINSTDAARLACCDSGSTSMAFSTDSGATWTTRTAPLAPTAATYGFLYGRGATWIFGDSSAGVFYKSTDDGANWSQISAPVGFTGLIGGILADANRWYMVSGNGAHVATSTDLTTWTVRNVSNAAPTGAIPKWIAATSSNNVVLFSNSGAHLVTNDGGVTWYWETPAGHATFTGTSGSAPVVATTGTTAILSGTNTTSVATDPLVVLDSEITAGGGSYRSTSATVAALRTNATAYARVA